VQEVSSLQRNSTAASSRQLGALLVLGFFEWGDYKKADGSARPLVHSTSADTPPLTSLGMGHAAQRRRLCCLGASNHGPLGGAKAAARGRLVVHVTGLLSASRA
jgi:hypothetical protein